MPVGSHSKLILTEEYVEIYETVLRKTGKRDCALYAVACQLVDDGTIKTDGCPVIEDAGVFVTEDMQIIGWGPRDQYDRPVMWFCLWIRPEVIKHRE